MVDGMFPINPTIFVGSDNLQPLDPINKIVRTNAGQATQQPTNAQALSEAKDSEQHRNRHANLTTSSQATNNVNDNIGHVIDITI
jgi:hypothetical protein